MGNEQNSNSYIIRQAENIIDDYVKNKQSKHNIYYYKEKYERLKILSIIMGIVSVLGILFTILFK